MRSRVTAVALLLLPVVSAACGANPPPPSASSLLPGTTRHTIDWNRRPRTYLLHRPANRASGLHAALVVVLHGASLTADQTERYYHWDPLADAQGFAVVYPQGVNNAWNAGSCCADAPERGTDDVGFIAAVLADATALADADPGRRYLTGVSNGAMMAMRFHCERPSQLAAIGSVAGTLTSPCDHPSPVAFIAIHGLDDQVVAYDQASGDQGSGTAETGPGMRLPARETIARFLAADQCRDPVTQSAAPVHTETATCAPGTDVKVITIDGAGHQWPGATLDAARLARDGPHDQPSRAIDATAELWSFFSSHVGGEG